MGNAHIDDGYKKQEDPHALVQKNDTENHTIFDDVFRTIAQKMPFLLIPLINEVFKTNYSQEQTFQQLRNEHYEKFGKVITDSIIQIEEHTYHIECQSKKDGMMAIRMMEYDFAIALEDSFPSDNEMIEVNFPESCVLYIRNHKYMPDFHEARIRFADGQLITYRVPVILAQNYTVNKIFEKHLLLLLPYHILRYEAFLKSNQSNKQKLEPLLADYQEIYHQLSALQHSAPKIQLYVDLIELINQIADYIIPKDNPSRERIGEIMGGKILKLKSELLIEQGIEQGVNRVNQLNLHLISEKRFDDLARASADKQYQAQLYKEYGI